MTITTLGSPGASYHPEPAGGPAASGGAPRAMPGPREIPQIIYRTKRDEEAAKVYLNAPVAAQATPENPALQSIRRQLVAICDQAHAMQWKPVPGVGETLKLVAGYLKNATPEERQALDTMLDDTLAQALSVPPLNETVAAHRVRDILLLSIAIQRTQMGEDPMQFLAGFAEDGLELPNFSIRTEGEAEPPQLHFDSTLPSFANATYRFGPLGRTLLLEGARTCFAGPSQAERGDKLRDIIFALKNPPDTGEPLEYDSDRFMALLEMGFDI
ncbi:hypothetical protein BOSP111201_02865 [Bordetella sputigena]|uniref:hypothetical protein n=1 Tax=Bordetella sputigena TaxID=1416810 RepID=UPI0039EE9F5D